MANKSTLFTTRNFTSKNKVFAVIDECRKVNNCLTTIKTETIDNHFHHDFHIPEENIYRPTKWDSFTPPKYKINLIHTLTYRYCRICSSSVLLQSALDELRKLHLQNGHAQGTIIFALTML